MTAPLLSSSAMKLAGLASPVKLLSVKLLSAAHQKHHQAKLSNKLSKPPRVKCQKPCPQLSESGSSQLGLETRLVLMTTHAKHLELRVGEVRDKTLP